MPAFNHVVNECSQNRLHQLCDNELMRLNEDNDEIISNYLQYGSYVMYR